MISYYSVKLHKNEIINLGSTTILVISIYIMSSYELKLRLIKNIVDGFLLSWIDFLGEGIKRKSHQYKRSGREEVTSSGHGFPVLHLKWFYTPWKQTLLYVRLLTYVSL